MERDISRNGHGRFLNSMVGIQPQQNQRDRAGGKETLTSRRNLRAFERRPTQDENPI
jgi:hypothetical protein